MNEVVLVRHLDFNGMTDEFPLKLAFLNSHFQTGLRNLLDTAITNYLSRETRASHESMRKEASLENGGALQVVPPMSNDAKLLSSQFQKVDEIPFDFVRRRMSVILQDVQSKEGILIAKGAVDEMTDVCSHLYLGRGTGSVDSSPMDMTMGLIPQMNVTKITDEQRQALKKRNEQLNEEGFRVIAVAFRQFNIDSTVAANFSVGDESGMIFAGFMAFLDPPKDSTAPALEELRRHKVEVKVLTGDSPAICRKVCEQIGMQVKGIITTGDLIGLTDKEVEGKVESANIFARLTPLQKAQVVRALKNRGHVVGFLGDGINDAPALRESDCGISVDTGTDIAKESADMILTEKSLMVLAHGVRRGRITYGNTTKYIKMVGVSGPIPVLTRQGGVVQLWECSQHLGCHRLARLSTHAAYSCSRAEPAVRSQSNCHPLGFNG